MSFRENDYRRINKSTLNNRRYILESPSNNPGEKVGLNTKIVDPWVKQILDNNIHLSRFYPNDDQLEFLYPRNVQQPKFNNRNFPNPFIENKSIEKARIENVNRSSRKWILQSPDYSNNNTLNNNSHTNKIQINFQPIRREDQKSPIYTSSSNSKESVNSVGYSSKEKRNIIIYIIGIMLYKFGLESFNGSIVSLATNRYDRDAYLSGIRSSTFEKVGLIVGLNQLCQCIGSILISPLVKHYKTRTILSISIFLFGLFTALLMIIDAITGGKIKPSNYIPMYENDYRYYGKYPTNLIIPIYCLTGISYGMVELIRRIIPQDIVGTNQEKLEKMDAIVHVFYEVAGVSGALITGLVLIPRLGNNYSFMITPILFSLSAVVWFFLNLSQKNQTNKISNNNLENLNRKKNYLKSILKGFYMFIESIYIGGKIIFLNRKYIWLLPCYSLTLYIHRYIENGLAPQIAKRYLKNSEWSQIIVGGSNFGELLGALSVFILTKKIHSPIVWLRLDSILLLIIWYIPFYNPSTINIKHAFIIALTFIPFGFGSAGDDVSLNAYIQSTLTETKYKNKDVSSLSSVMAFLYSSYIILYAILNPLLGKYIDSVYNTNQTIRPALIYTAGVQITLVSIIVAISTFIPKHSFKLNPSLD